MDKTLWLTFLGHSVHVDWLLHAVKSKLLHCNYFICSNEHRRQPLGRVTRP